MERKAGIATGTVGRRIAAAVVVVVVVVVVAAAAVVVVAVVVVVVTAVAAAAARRTVADTMDTDTKNSLATGIHCGRTNNQRHAP